MSELFAARAGVPATAAALRDLTDEELLDLQDRLDAPGPDREELPRVVLAPFADGELVPEPVPRALTAGGAGADVPLILGSPRTSSTWPVPPRWAGPSRTSSSAPRLATDADPGPSWPRPYTPPTRATRIWSARPHTAHDPLREMSATLPG